MVRGMCKGGARGAKVHEEYILRVHQTERMLKRGLVEL